MLNSSGFRFGILALAGAESTIANLMSGFALAAASVASSSLKPTATMTLHLALTIAVMFVG